ncbi:superoxide dismutase family protein [Luteolibacter marinus]|uniref:superoxide dismutase family protein n=1 Tax=Luteolibacter marinus TaxID=2776705 RepID=UPI001869656B|nr:superoxide dismutase family protein [Luteolibacter marinus]
MKASLILFATLAVLCSEPAIADPGRPVSFTGRQQLVARILPAGGSHVEGSVLFRRTNRGIEVIAKIGGLRPDAVHAIRLQAAPSGEKESHSHHDRRRPDDLGNLMSDANGNATHILELEDVKWDTGQLQGLTVVVHRDAGGGDASADDAGDAIGTGVLSAGNLR